MKYELCNFLQIDQQFCKVNAHYSIVLSVFIQVYDWTVNFNELRQIGHWNSNNAAPTAYVNFDTRYT